MGLQGYWAQPVEKLVGVHGVNLSAVSMKGFSPPKISDPMVCFFLEISNIMNSNCHNYTQGGMSNSVLVDDAPQAWY